MNNAQTLTHHRDIQNWVTARHGMPAITRQPSSSGEVHARLALSFGKARARPHGAPVIDDGIAPVSWSAWLAELDRQHLALKVSAQSDPDFEFVDLEDVAKDSDTNSGDTLN